MEQAPPTRYLRRLFGPSDRIAVVAVPRGAGKVAQRFPTAAGACAERFQGWLRHLNAQGYDIFVGVNPVGPRKRREKEDVVSVRRLQLDLDEDGGAGLKRVLDDVELGKLPAPAGILRTSENRYQVLWHTLPGWEQTRAETVMTGLALRYGGDRAVADIARVMRLPGFRNKKPGRGDAMVTWVDLNGAAVAPESFGDLPAPPKGNGRPAPGWRATGMGVSQSERDWAWARSRLRRGESPSKLTAELEASRQDKPKPGYYADRTVRRAAESLAIEEGRR